MRAVLGSKDASSGVAGAEEAAMVGLERSAREDCGFRGVDVGVVALDVGVDEGTTTPPEVNEAEGRREMMLGHNKPSS